MGINEDEIFIPKIKINLGYSVLNSLEIAKNEEINGIDGSLKLEKVTVNSLLNFEEEGMARPEILRNFRGPTNPGLSRLIQSLNDLSIIELREMKRDSYNYSIKEKGLKILDGFKKFYSSIHENFSETEEKINSKIKDDIKKSGNELANEERIKDIKNKKVLGEKF